jgi:molybdate transport system regulatory protein
MDDLPLATLKIRLRHGGIFAMGPGKADLLEAIQETRSIAAAGRKLGLSYWKTRRLLAEMNRSFQGPVVAATKGGEKGGGSLVTETGLTALAQFRAMEAGASAAIEAQVLAFQELLAPEETEPETQEPGRRLGAEKE